MGVVTGKSSSLVCMFEVHRVLLVVHGSVVSIDVVLCVKSSQLVDEETVELVGSVLVTVVITSVVVSVNTSELVLPEVVDEVSTSELVLTDEVASSAVLVSDRVVVENSNEVVSVVGVIESVEVIDGIVTEEESVVSYDVVQMSVVLVMVTTVDDTTISLVGSVLVRISVLNTSEDETSVVVTVTESLKLVSPDVAVLVVVMDSTVDVVPSVAVAVDVEAVVVVKSVEVDAAEVTSVDMTSEDEVCEVVTSVEVTT